jgi:hypothetical protein
MMRRKMILFFGIVLLLGELAISPAKAQQNSGSIKAVHLIGLTGVKDNAKGALGVENGQLHFVRGKASSDVSATSILDVVTGTDSEKAVGKTIGMMSMAAPYGGGRFLSLFRKKIDTLTIEYRDADGSLHGVIFTMPVGGADQIKKELVAQGGHTTIAAETDASQVPSASSTGKEKKQ